MSRKGERRRIAEGIYADDGGLSATVKVGKINAKSGTQSGTDLKVLLRC